MFQNFNQFGFMFDRLAQPLKVYVPVDGKKRNKLGLPATSDDAYEKPLSVTEPIVSNSNPNLTYHNAGGGQVSVGELYWTSKHDGYPLGTKVQTSDGHEYKVISHGLDMPAGLTYYQVQEVGGDE